MMSAAAILKYTGAILTTILGILGLTATVREERTGQLTSRGRLLLSGIVASGLVLIVTQVAEDAQSAADRNQLLQQVMRGQYPLRDVRLICWAEVSLDNAESASFRERFTTGATARRSAWGLAWRNGKPLHDLSVCYGDELYPRKEDEPVPYAIFSGLEVSARVYRTPIDPARYLFRGLKVHQPVTPDLFITFRNNDPRSCIEYEIESGRFLARSWDLATDPLGWNSSGKIISVGDLLGAQAFIAVTPLVVRTASREIGIERTRPRLILRIGEFSDLWIWPEELTEHMGTDGRAYYEYRFPTSTDAMFRPRVQPSAQ